MVLRSLISERSLIFVALMFCLIPPDAHAGHGDREAAALAAVPEQYAGSTASAPLSEDVWWQTFGVGELDQIVWAGLEANPDLLTAERQLAQAQALAAQGLAALLPSVSLSGSLNGQPLEAQTFFFDFPSGAEVNGNVWTGNAGVNASWNIDLWGANLLNFLAGRQDALAAAHNTTARRLTISTSIANAWFDVVYHQARLETIMEQVALSESLLELTEFRYERGEAAALNVLQQRQQLQTTQALLPQSRALLRIAEMQLAVLLGRRPEASPTVLVTALPDVPPTPSTGQPGDLVTRAPGVLAAQAQLASAEHLQRAALRLTMPQLALSAAYGPQYRYEAEGLLWDDFDDDINSASFWSAGGQLSWPIFNGGSAYNTYRAAVAGADAARYSLESAALAALQQVEGALVLEEERALLREAVEAQRDAARLSLQAAQDQYQTGQTTFIPVLSAQQTMLQAELSALQAHRDQIDARIQLYSALGAATSAQGSTP